MPRKYRMDIRTFVLNLYTKKKRTVKQIKEFTGISKSSIYRWTKKGTQDKKITRKDNKRKLVIPLLLEMIKANCTLTRKQIKERFSKQGIDISLRTIFTAMKEAKLTRKRMKYFRLSKNLTDESKAKYKKTYNDIIDDDRDVYFFDESHISDGLLPLYGYSQANVPCYTREPSSHTSYSLLFAFSKHGDIKYSLLKGSMDAQNCQVFLNDIKDQRIVMDNLSSHKLVKLGADGEKIFTPVASPQANPVEIIFSKIKMLYRRINNDNKDLSIEQIVEAAIDELSYDDVINTIEHVKTYVNNNY